MSPAFFEIHRALPREGPGDRQSLDWALRMAALPKDAAILDAGCGPGADIPALLTHAPQGRVRAVDLHGPFVWHVQARFGFDRRVTAVHGDMTAQNGPFDFIWSAGAVYAVGIGPAMAAFRRMLRPGGRVAFSHLCWTGAERPAEAAAFWAGEAPEMADLDTTQAQIAAAGGRVLGRTLVSPQGWAAYYGPLEARIAALEAAVAEGRGAEGQGGNRADDIDDADMAEQLAAHRREIEVWQAHGDSYGYAVFLVAP